MTHHTAALKRPHALRLASGLLVATLLSCLAAGCEVSRSTAEFPEFPPDSVVRDAVPLDIQVTRNEARITLTNSVARAFGPSNLWANRWYSRPIDGLAVGETLTLDLSEFRDSEGIAFRAGGFFATKRPDRLVSFHIQTKEEEREQWFSLTVVAGPE